MKPTFSPKPQPRRSQSFAATSSQVIASDNLARLFGGKNPLRFGYTRRPYFTRIASGVLTERRELIATTIGFHAIPRHRSAK